MSNNLYDKLPIDIQEKIEDLAFKQLVLDTVKEAEKKYECELCSSGFYSFKGEKVCKYEKRESWDYEDIKQAIPVINVLFEKRKTINTQNLWSYSLKHCVEKYKRYPYISNGDCIVAMLICGYKMRVSDHINCEFNVKINRNIPKSFNIRKEAKNIKNKVTINILKQIYINDFDEYIKEI